MEGDDHNYMHTYVSVDCVIFGFDGEKLNLLLVERARAGAGESDLKLPGSIIYQHEDTDIAAERVLFELTGIKKIKLKQFRCFSSADRAADPSDQAWLRDEYGPQMPRLITVAYIALTKINRRLNVVPKYKSARWYPVDSVGKMPFDHNCIVDQAISEIHNWIMYDPAMIFELLPSKFTASELRRIYEAIYRRKFDVRNFHKKISAMEYIVALDECQREVAHRAARYYRFDKVIYNKRKTSI